MEEDFVGAMTRVIRGSVHSATVARRVLQRWLLHFNAEMIRRGRV